MKQRHPDKNPWQNFYAHKRTPPEQPTMKFRPKKRKYTNPYDPDFMDTCAKLFKAGLPIEEISQKLHCARSSVSKALKARGLTRMRQTKCSV